MLTTSVTLFIFISTISPPGFEPTTSQNRANYFATKTVHIKANSA